MKRHSFLQAFSQRIWKIVCYLFFSVTLFFSIGNSVYATVVCDIQNNMSITLGASSVPVTADMPPGTVVFSQTLPSLPLKCARKITGTGSNNQVMLIVNNTSTSTITRTLGLSVYINYKGIRANTTQWIDTGIDGSNFPPVATAGSGNVGWVEVPFNEEVNIEFVKTGTTPAPGTSLTQSSLLLFGFAGQGESIDSGVVLNNIRNGFIVPAETCDVSIDGSPNKMVTLPKISAADIGGVGNTAEETPFSIQMSCLTSTPIPGTFKALLALTGSVIPGTKDVLVNTGTASGIGVQIKSNSAAVINGGQQQVGEYPNQIKIPFSAAYYQTENDVSPGTVNSIMSYMISYE